MSIPRFRVLEGSLARTLIDVEANAGLAHPTGQPTAPGGEDPVTAAAVLGLGPDLGLGSGAIGCLRGSGGSPSWRRSLSWRLSLETAVHKVR